ncbi:MAG: response regulator transcription factor [Elusimicrobia bacterium]|nr:response regulator transcription factor [Elusimicrobiota bacterium]
MCQRRVLVIDDEEVIHKLIHRILVPHEYKLISAKSGREGLDHAHKIDPHLVILDLAMPGLNGIDTFKLLRSSPKTINIPIMISTGLGDTSHVLRSSVEALGAQAFLSKPFTAQELLWQVDRLARVRSPLSPSSRLPAVPAREVPKPCLLRCGRVCVDIGSRKVWAGGRRIDVMGPKRFDLLCFLMRHQAGALREQLLYQVWGGDGDYKMVDVMVHRLRHDLQVNGHSPIVSIPGGYKLVG